MNETRIGDRVVVSVTDGIARVRLSRPDKRNALDGAMFRAIAEAGARVAAMHEVRVVVLSGEGASFCAGLDFGSFAEMAGGASGAAPGDGAAATIGTLTEGGITHLAQQICWVWQEVPVPVVAALQGHALGGGMQLALGADLRVAHPEVQMSMREVHWGLVPDMTGTLMLSRLVRDDVAKDLVWTARIVRGDEAHALGLVTRLADDPVAAAEEMAREIAARSPSAVRAALKALIRRMGAGSGGGAPRRR
ncbi:MAG: crotonase/enoyl-CoA hydratase family protein [Ilumatobacteraceae bacterium]